MSSKHDREVVETLLWLLLYLHLWTLPSKRGTQVAKTLPLDDAEGRLPTTIGPPIANWDRYELLDLLGKGGMGSVYKARDHRLGRIIAIKFLLGADPNLTMRFLREARAQARVDHPNICRVYEVGEVEGRAYIALQFIDGEPLHKAAARMSLDEKIAVMRDIAVAIQEAHRLGIVHRDLKPANIMVERTEDGRWCPIVMDFGLAREATIEPGLTASGALLGTPAYMSPEQARGDVVDRRSDVYSLGATLYELLTGRPPFSTTALAEVLAQVIHDDPSAPRSLVPNLPIDLETIALKCLAKDPTQRYPSARALADDLGRYLNGEPILGRRLSLWQRLRRRARRHRALVTLGASSLAIILAVAAFGVRAWISARREHELTEERTRLAERLARDAKDIELSLRMAYLLPLRDTRPHRERIRAQMRTIASTRHDLGELGDAVIHEALGRGHLALHEWREAADELARAANTRRQTPELHAALGQALGALYHLELENARRSGDAAWLDRRKQELAQQYLMPALAELDQSRASGENAAFLEALIAFYRGNFAGAEKLAQAVAEHTPELFEARKLAADAAYNAALEAFDHGNYNAALPGLDRATTLYAEASEIARSDASVYEAAAQTWLQHAEIDVRQSHSPRESLDHALDIIDRALLAAPDDAPAYTTKAYVLLRWYRASSLAGLDDEQSLVERVAQAASRAVEIDPQNARAWDALGNAHVYQGIYEHSHEGEGAPWWNQAFGEFGKALTIQPNDPWANNDLGTAHRWLGDDLAKTGHDPMLEYQAALRSYERATAIDPQYVYAWSNQVELHASIAEYDTAVGIDPRPAVEGAQRAGERGLKVNPNYYRLLYHMTRAQLAFAQHLLEADGDPIEALVNKALVNARDYLHSAEIVHPAAMETWFYSLVAASAEAKLRLRERADPTSAIAMGRTALNKAMRLAPDSVYVYVEAARLSLTEAAWAAHARRDVASRLAQACANAEKAVSLNGKLADAELTAAEVYLQLATVQRSRAIIDRGIAHADRALKLNQRLARAGAVHTALLQLRAVATAMAAGFPARR
jgi:tetratricopeptide (TPR) repeat protein/predicted Ser/Thr protein kinase